MNLKNSVRSAALAVMLFSAGAANAALYQFNLTGDYTASWQLDSAVVPDISATGLGFALWEVEGSFPGSRFDLVSMTFYNAAFSGGLRIHDRYSATTFLHSNGPQLYTGADSAPLFRLGSFGLTDVEGPGNYTLTVDELSAEPSPVPEPGTVAMLLGGLGLLYASRKRRRGN